MVGAGPAGLEAARVSAERGHDVVLFERDDLPGGQINLATRVAWRESLSGITRWLDQQVRKLGVDCRYGREANLDTVLAESPDAVVIATGGRPNPGEFEGRDLAVSTWDILLGRVQPGESVLLIDDHGGDQGPGCGEFLAERGSRVEIATPERQLLAEVGMVNFSSYLRRLYSRDVIISPDLRLQSVQREGNRLVAVLRNEFSLREEERLVDQVVIEHGTLPELDLYEALRPHSVNDGETDLHALVGHEPQAIVHNPGGAFRLFRVGDAWTSRNIHAAIYDSKRLCMTL